MSLNATSEIVVRLDRLDRNVAAWRERIGEGVKLGAVIKAGAYGLGAEEIGSRLERAGVDMLLVYSLAQAVEVLEAHLTRPIMVLSPRLDQVDLRALLEEPVLGEALSVGRLHLVVETGEEFEAVGLLARRVAGGKAGGGGVPIHLHVETGMNRGALTVDEFVGLVPRVLAASRDGVRLAGVMTHMARGDEATVAGHHKRFVSALERLGGRDAAWREGVWLHTSSTQPALSGSRIGHDLYDMVRVGIGLYGFGEGPGFEQVVSWRSRLTQVYRRPRGERVGYRHSYTLARDSLLGIVPVGYGAGYPLSLSNRGVVEVNGRGAAVLGRISMDQLVVDLTDHDPGPGVDGVKTGDRVIVYSDDKGSPCSVARLADLAETHPYELLCRLSPAVPRRYVGADPG